MSERNICVKKDGVSAESIMKPFLKTLRTYGTPWQKELLLLHTLRSYGTYDECMNFGGIMVNPAVIIENEALLE